MNVESTNGVVVFIDTALLSAFSHKCRCVDVRILIRITVFCATARWLTNGQQRISMNVQCYSAVHHHRSSSGVVLDLL